VVDSIGSIAAEEELTYDTAASVAKAIAKAKKQMETAAKNLDFMEAAKWRDELQLLEKKKASMVNG
jgi:excinuclease ABC subunit B